MKNQDGVKELYKIISSIENTPDGSFVDLSVLMQNRKNLLVGANVLVGAISCDYIELYPTTDKQEEMNKKLYIYVKEQGIPVVAVSNAHYFSKDEAICREIVRSSRGERGEEVKNLYLRTTKEMLDEYLYLGKEGAEDVVLNNAQLICDLIEKVEPMKKGDYDYQLEHAFEQIENIALDRAWTLYGKPLPDIVLERLKTELDLIKANEFASKYLIAYEIAKHIVDSGHNVGTRGTIGSSLVAFLLGITEINPLQPHYYCPHCHYFEKNNLVIDEFDLPEKKCPCCENKLNTAGHNIPYESFMGAEGNKKPQFTFNVSPVIQTHVMEHMRTLFGTSNVARAGVIHRYIEHTAQKIISEYENINGVLFSNEEKEEIIQKVSGIKKNEDVHPGGVILIPKNMEFEDFAPVKRNAETLVSTHFDFYDLPLLKFDMLCYTTIQLLETLQEKTGVKLNKINLKDSGVLESLAEFDIIGLPGYDTEFMWDLFAKTMPKTFLGLLKVNGLAHGTNTWIENGEYLIEEGVDLLQLPAFREDIMNDLIHIGVERKKAYEFSEKVRRGWFARKRVNDQEMQDYKEMLKPLGDWYFEYCSKVRYMFPKAHAVAYVYNDIRCAWFKKYYPKEFYETFEEIGG